MNTIDKSSDKSSPTHLAATESQQTAKESQEAVKNSSQAARQSSLFAEKTSQTTKKTVPAAKKSLGQNFLQDVNIARKIVEALHIGPEDRVIEIGPGPGALTRHLLDSPAQRLLLVEKDSYWVRHHCESHHCSDPLHQPDSLYKPEFQDLSELHDPLESQPQSGLQNQSAAQCDYEKSGQALGLKPLTEWAHTFYSDGPRLLVGEADALAVPWKDFSEPVKIIGNLPYNVASPLMWDILSQSRGCERAVFMIQKEVGLRLVAKPKSRDYGALSVWIQSFCTPKIEFIVPPQVFHPRPKVHSAVVSFSPVALNPALDYEALASLVKICFQARRKQLGNSLKRYNNIEEIFIQTNIQSTQRPEELAPVDFHKLVMALFPKNH